MLTMVTIKPTPRYIQQQKINQQKQLELLRQEEYRRALDEQSTSNREREAYKVLQTAVNRSGAFVKGSQERVVMDAFEGAGLDREEGRRLYRASVKSSTAYTSAMTSNQNVAAITQAQQDLATGKITELPSWMGSYVPTTQKAANEAAVTATLKAYNEGTTFQDKQGNNISYQDYAKGLVAGSGFQPTGINNQQQTMSGTITREETGTDRLPNGKSISIGKFIFTDTNGNKRLATKEEVDLYTREQNTLSFETGTAKPNDRTTYEKIKSKVMDVYEPFNTNVIEGLSNPIFGSIEKVSGSSIKDITYKAVDLSGGVPFIPQTESVKQFETGVITGTIEDIRYNPVKNVVLYAAGAGIGYGASAGIFGLTKIPLGTWSKPATSVQTIYGKLSSLKATTTIYGTSKEASVFVPSVFGERAAMVTKTGLYGVGGYITAAALVSTGVKVYNAKTPYEQGSIVGVDLKDYALIGLGTSGGIKGFKQTVGYFKTMGKTELDIPQGDYPTLAAGKQLQTFKNNIYKELGKEAGAFHTTPNQFWMDKITPTAGTSELPALYGGHYISRPFAKIGGSGSSISTKGIIQEMTSTTYEPAVAFLKPKGFRLNKGVKTPTYFIGEQAFKYKFSKPARKGYADIPNIKSEGEALFRKEAGSYNIESSNFYVKIKGVRVPLDTFKYEGGLIGTPTSTTASGTNLYGGRSSYSIDSVNVPMISGYTKSSNKVSKVSSKVSISNIYSSSVSGSSLSLSSVMPSSKSSSTSGSSRGSSSLSISNLYSSSVSSTSSRVSRGSLSTTSSYRPSSTSGSSRGSSSMSYTFEPPVTKRYEPKYNSLKSLGGIFTVQVRRKGKFYNVGKSSNLMEALSIGRGKVGRTLAATFRIGGTSKIGTPTGFYTKRTKEGTLFIEQPKYRLSTRSEVAEIFGYKRASRRRK